MVILCDQGREFFVVLYFLQGFCLFGCVNVIVAAERKFLQLSCYNSSRLSEDLDAVSGSVAEFLCDPTHAIFMSFSFSHLKKENKQDDAFFLSVPLLFMHTYDGSYLLLWQQQCYIPLGWV